MGIKKSKTESKNILVTGGAGFIGSHLVNRLIETGNRVVVIDNLSSGSRENINKKAKFYEMDTRNTGVADVIKKEKIERVFHLAAQALVDAAYGTPFATIESNVMGTTNLLESCRLNGKIKAIIVASSDKAYGKSKELPYVENTPLKGNHPYDVSKTITDLLAQTYAKTYNLPIVITRFSNVFGPNDINLNRIIPGVFESIIKNKELLIRSDGKMIREYTYVRDITEGCIKLDQNIDNIKGEAFNFGSKNIFSVLEVVRKTEEILKARVDYRILNIAKNEIPKQYLDWTKAKKMLGWQPKTSFEQGIREAFEWYKNYFSKS
ncbi:MAG: GDP-mannose 4,6-dehydratase [Candidatus Portnoybacteria bacterium]